MQVRGSGRVQGNGFNKNQQWDHLLPLSLRVAAKILSGVGGCFAPPLCKLGSWCNIFHLFGGGWGATLPFGDGLEESQPHANSREVEEGDVSL